MIGQDIGMKAGYNELEAMVALRKKNIVLAQKLMLETASYVGKSQ